MSADLHQDTGAMALDALDPSESAAFLEHLDDCPVCSRELIGFSETVALLGSAVAATPPPSLRVSVLEAIRVTPQLPPITVETADPQIGRHRQSDSVPPADGVVVPFRQRAWYRRPQTLIAAAVVAVALIAGSILLTNRSASVPQQAGSCPQSASDRVTKAPVIGNGGEMLYSPSCGEATVTPAGLPKLAAGKVYQLWVLKGAAARSVGVMTIGPNGTVDPKQATVQAGDTGTAISIEDAPGPATTPSSDVVWTSAL